MPHRYSFQVFIKSVQLKLTVDISIYLVLSITAIATLLQSSTSINSFFELMYDEYESSFYWEVVKGVLDSGETLDMTSPEVMGVMGKMD